MPENYRILYFSSQFPNNRSPSMGVFSLQRVRALRHAGCELLVISPLLMTPPPQLITRPLQAYDWIRGQARLPFKNLIDGIQIYYPKWICPPRNLIGWQMSFFQDLQVQKSIRKLCKEFQPDLILSSWLPDAVAVSKLGHALNLPILAIADGTDVNEWPRKYRGWNHARDILNKRIAAIIFVSEALKEIGNAQGLFGRRNAVIHNAVDTQLFKPATSVSNDIYTILSVGRLVPGKGFHILLEAFKGFSHRFPQPARLVLVGDGPQKDALLRQAADLEISSSVEWVGPMEQEKLAKYYQQADLFCLPSFSEGLPCVVVEAMACGKPVVASDVGGVGEIVDEQSGVLVPPGKVDALREALVQARNRKWDAEYIREKMKAEFDWSCWTKRMLSLIESVQQADV